MYSIKSILFVMAGFSLGLLSFSSAYAASQSHIDAARNFLEINGDERRLIKSMDVPSFGIPGLDAAFGQLKQNAGFLSVQSKISELAPKFREQFVEIYVNKYSEAELIELSSFLRRPVGQKYLAEFQGVQFAEAKILIEELVKADPKISAALDAEKQRKAQADLQLIALEGQAANGDRQAMYRLGENYCSRATLPTGRAENLAKCFAWKLKSAEQGFVEAQFDIGLSYANSRYEKPKNPPEALKWLKRAGEQGHLSASYIVGSLYAGRNTLFGSQPSGIEVNAVEAAEWLKKAAQAGNMSAVLDLASMYFDGSVLEQSYLQARRFYQQAADKGNTLAMRKLGEIYERGLGVEASQQESMQWYKKAAGIK